MTEWSGQCQSQTPEPKVASHACGLPVTFSLAPLEAFDSSQILVEAVNPIDSQFGQFGGRCLLLRNILTPDECAYLVAEMSSDTLMEPVNYRTDYRRNDRCIFESGELAELLWSRVQPVAEALAIHVNVDLSRQGLGQPSAGGCPSQLQVGYGNEGLWKPVGLNECLRFCRYTPGGFFRPHCDATFRKSDEEMSLFTCMFYLDADMVGGATRFLKIDATLTSDNYLQLAHEEEVLASLAPATGQCLLFFQPGLLHEGEDLLRGVKHILRTDVMFRREPGTKAARTDKEEEAWRLVQRAQALESAGSARDCDEACQLYRRAFKLDPKLERLL